MLDLTAKIKVTKPYTGRSKFSFWHNLEDGDILHVIENLKDEGKYMPNVYIKNLRNGDSFLDSRNSICNYLKNIKFDILGI
jgi:hypothetical protein